MRFRDRVIDLGLAVLSIPAWPLLYWAGRKRWALRLTRRIHDHFKITVVANHYYEPVFTDADLSTPSDQARLLPGIDFNMTGQMATLEKFRFADELATLNGSAVNEHVYRYENQNRMFAEGDADALYSFIRAYKPATVIEIGCGQSSIVAELALRKNHAEDAGPSPRHICFEPFHNGWLHGIGADFRALRVEQVDLSIFQDLKPNDMVFIDSTHVLRPQGDIEHEFLRILPLLPAGVLVHIHDIFTPRDYSQKFLREDRRFWTEQYVLEAFLSHNRDYEILLALNDLHAQREPKLYEALPILADHPQAQPGSFWIRRRS